MYVLQTVHPIFLWAYLTVPRNREMMFKATQNGGERRRNHVVPWTMSGFARSLRGSLVVGGTLATYSGWTLAITQAYASLRLTMYTIYLYTHTHIFCFNASSRPCQHPLRNKHAEACRRNLCNIMAGCSHQLERIRLTTLNP